MKGLIWNLIEYYGLPVGLFTCALTVLLYFVPISPGMTAVASLVLIPVALLCLIAKVELRLRRIEDVKKRETNLSSKLHSSDEN